MYKVYVRLQSVFASGLTWPAVYNLLFCIFPAICSLQSAFFTDRYDSSCLFSKGVFSKAVYSFKTGTTIIISQHLENVPSSQCYLNVELINPECLVTSMSRVAVGGMTSGTMITCWIIQLTYRISSDLQLMIKIS